MKPTVIGTGGGCQAWQVREREAPGLYALITDDDCGVPHALGPFTIGVYADADDGEPLSFVELADVDAARDWYESNVGHRADGDDWIAILHLIAGAMLLAKASAS